MTKHTYFIDVNGDDLGNDEGILPISLYKGMRITIHGYSENYEVVEWNYHLGHEDEDGGLRIIVQSI